MTDGRVFFGSCDRFHTRGEPPPAAHGKAMTSPPFQSLQFSPGDILEAARTLGVLHGNPQAAPAVLAALCAEGVSAAEVAAIIRNEPGLAARVLRVANSAFYGLSRSVSTIERAVVVLGLDSVRGVAATACLDRTLVRTADSSPVDMDRILRHSIATAAGAEAVARVRHRALAADAFIAGLLHDFGVVLQLRLNPRGMADMISLVGQPDVDLRTLEKEHVGIGHEACAEVVFETWKLPAGLVAAVAHHHDPAGAVPGDRVLAAAIYLGNELSGDCGMASPCEPVAGGRLEEVLALTGLSAGEYAAIRDALPARVKELGLALS